MFGKITKIYIWRKHFSSFFFFWDSVDLVENRKRADLVTNITCFALLTKFTYEENNFKSFFCFQILTTWLKTEDLDFWWWNSRIVHNTPNLHMKKIIFVFFFFFGFCRLGWNQKQCVCSNKQYVLSMISKIYIWKNNFRLFFYFFLVCRLGWNQKMCAFSNEHCMLCMISHIYIWKKIFFVFFLFSNIFDLVKHSKMCV